MASTIMPASWHTVTDGQVTDDTMPRCARPYLTGLCFVYLSTRVVMKKVNVLPHAMA